MSLGLKTSRKINLLIERDDDDLLVKTILGMRQKNKVSESEILLAGVLSFFSLDYEYDHGAEIIESLLDTSKRKQAAIWLAYRYVHLQPDRLYFFEKIISSEKFCPYCMHMQSLVYLQQGKYDQFEEKITQSLLVKKFPKNIISFLKNSKDSFSLKADFIDTLNDSVLVRNSEKTPKPKTVDGYLNQLWNEYIEGCTFNSILWEYVSQKYQLKSDNIQ